MSFFFNDTATTEIYTLSLHDALPIWRQRAGGEHARGPAPGGCRSGADAAGGPQPARERRPVLAAWPADRDHGGTAGRRREDRKSTRLNSSHANISYAVFCLKKKNTMD